MNAIILVVVGLLPMPENKASCIYLEDNTVLRSDGGLRIRQWIFWDRFPRKGIVVKEWIPHLGSCVCGPVRSDGKWVGWWRMRGGEFVRVESECYWQTTTFYDPEVLNRKILPNSCRDGLINEGKK